jgi:phage shock protein PspC (stress-responsive transcriptional regulator)
MASTTTVSDTVQDFWNTRPVRPHRGGKIGGVAAAIGERYGIDPVLPRVAFVVGVIYGGAGLVLYLLGWLLLPKEVDAEGHTRDRPKAVPAALALLLLFVVVPRMGLHGWFGLVVGLSGLVLLHRYRGRSALPAGSSDRDSDAESEREQAATPPDWDPLGAAPFAWDLPEPPQPEAESVAPHRRWITPVTLALAVVAGVLAQVVVASPTVTVATALAVLGAGMLAGSFLRGGRMLIWFAIPLVVVALTINIAPTMPWSGVHDVHESASTGTEVLPHYGTSVGTVSLHLDDLHMAPDQQIHTNVDVGVGTIAVYVPKDANVTARCASDVGTLRCLGPEQRGVQVDQVTNDAGSDGHLVLDLNAHVGTVEVFRE